MNLRKNEIANQHSPGKKSNFEVFQKHYGTFCNFQKNKKQNDDFGFPFKSFKTNIENFGISKNTKISWNVLKNRQ